MANSKYIVRQPIKDPADRVLGYEILYYGENQLYGADEPEKRSGGQERKVNAFAVADTIYSFLTQNTETALRGSLNFMTFTTNLLMKKVPRLFEKQDLVIQIDDSVMIHPLAMHFIKTYKQEGYRIAVNQFQFAPRYLEMLNDIDFIKINLSNTAEVSTHNILEIANSMGKLCIATEVTSEALYHRAVSAGFYAMEGSFVAERLATRAHSSGYLKSNFFRLLAAVNRDEPDPDEIERIISVDASLSYALLRVANSVQFATRNRTTSVKQAIMKLGIGQLRQWAYLLSAGTTADGKIDPSFEEFLKLSLVRAAFCSELMNYTRAVPLSKGEAYLMGMFSTLHYLIDAPLGDILVELPVAEEIKHALLYQEGPAGMLYRLVLEYEKADWDQVNMLAEKLGIPTAALTNLYFQCMESADNLWKSLNNNASGSGTAR